MDPRDSFSVLYGIEEDLDRHERSYFTVSNCEKYGFERIDIEQVANEMWPDSNDRIYNTIRLLYRCGKWVKSLASRNFHTADSVFNSAAFAINPPADNLDGVEVAIFSRDSLGTSGGIVSAWNDSIHIYFTDDVSDSQAMQILSKLGQIGVDVYCVKYPSRRVPQNISSPPDSFSFGHIMTVYIEEVDDINIVQSTNITKLTVVVVDIDKPAASIQDKIIPLVIQSNIQEPKTSKKLTVRCSVTNLTTLEIVTDRRVTISGQPRCEFFRVEGHSVLFHEVSRFRGTSAIQRSSAKSSVIQKSSSNNENESGWTRLFSAPRRAEQYPTVRRCHLSVYAYDIAIHKSFINTGVGTVTLCSRDTVIQDSFIKNGKIQKIDIYTPMFCVTDHINGIYDQESYAISKKMSIINSFRDGTIMSVNVNGTLKQDNLDMREYDKAKKGEIAELSDFSIVDSFNNVGSTAVVCIPDIVRYVRNSFHGARYVHIGQCSIRYNISGGGHGYKLKYTDMDTSMWETMSRSASLLNIIRQNQGGDILPGTENPALYNAKKIEANRNAINGFINMLRVKRPTDERDNVTNKRRRTDDVSANLSYILRM
jgi:hypothetical protein